MSLGLWEWDGKMLLGVVLEDGTSSLGMDIMASWFPIHSGKRKMEPLSFGSGAAVLEVSTQKS